MYASSNSSKDFKWPRILDPAGCTIQAPTAEVEEDADQSGLSVPMEERRVSLLSPLGVPPAPPRAHGLSGLRPGHL